jgi:UDP-N-acetylglucosamine--N-acetylmuramyl-(pentapeptide) pyrophosphoryl-undecaprenol N-acetylglucosamine transferase
MRILLTGGGTGGHVYPALSVAAALPERAANEPIELLFAGTERGDVRRLVARAGIAFSEVAAAPIRGRGPLALIRSGLRIAVGVAQSWRMIGRFRPRAVLATGGYATVPVCLAAWLRRVPLVVYLPDIYPGWAVRLLAVLATRIAVTHEAAAAHLPHRKTIVTGYPVRQEFLSTDRDAARESLGLRTGVPLLLVTGATQGAQALNRAVLRALPDLLPRWTILHQTGESGLSEACAAASRLSLEQCGRYQPVAYIDDMPAAMAAADLAVMRAGASALAEPASAGLPSIVVPGAFAGAHQKHNATFMEAHGAAIMLEESHLDQLAGIVNGLLDDPRRLAMLAASARALARPDAARRIADILLGVAA